MWYLIVCELCCRFGSCFTFVGDGARLWFGFVDLGMLCAADWVFLVIDFVLVWLLVLVALWVCCGWFVIGVACWMFVGLINSVDFCISFFVCFYM